MMAVDELGGDSSVVAAVLAALDVGTPVASCDSVLPSAAVVFWLVGGAATSSSISSVSVALVTTAERGTSTRDESWDASEGVAAAAVVEVRSD